MSNSEKPTVTVGIVELEVTEIVLPEPVDPFHGDTWCAECDDDGKIVTGFTKDGRPKLKKCVECGGKGGLKADA